MKKILKVVFTAILCIFALTSCINDAEEAIADTPVVMETTEELTTLETASEETTETTTEDTSPTIPDEATILASLTDEEKEVWLSMPDIVTMRVLSRYDEEEKEYYSEFLYNEIIYIDKMGQIKKFIINDDPNSPYDDVVIAWLNDQISQNEDADLIDEADIHTLIEFYNTFMLIDRNTKFYRLYSIGLDLDIERHYWFEIYGIRDNGENGFETLLISRGDAECLTVQNEYTYNQWKLINTYGSDTLELYLELDPFVIPGVGHSGHLAGEEV